MAVETLRTKHKITKFYMQKIDKGFAAIFDDYSVVGSNLIKMYKNGSHLGKRRMSLHRRLKRPNWNISPRAEDGVHTFICSNVAKDAFGLYFSFHCFVLSIICFDVSAAPIKQDCSADFF